MNRRGFLTGILSALAMPAIIRTPGLLMPVKQPILLTPEMLVEPPSELPTIDMITREAIRLFRNSNWFLCTIDNQFPDMPPTIGRELRIRLPNDFAQGYV